MFRIIGPVALATLVLTGCQSTPRPELDAAVATYATRYAKLTPLMAEQCVQGARKVNFNNAETRVIREPEFSPHVTRKFSERLYYLFDDAPDLAKRLAVYWGKSEWKTIFGPEVREVVCFFDVNGDNVRLVEARTGTHDRIDAGVKSLYRAMGGKHVLASYLGP